MIYDDEEEDDDDDEDELETPLLPIFSSEHLGTRIAHGFEVGTECGSRTSKWNIPDGDLPIGLES